ncbi:MAG: DUF3048 domain-containing protein [Anaerolineales bacterium]|nr:DUF3048 domain-containing protein [Anaerolineales bacterium]
MRRLWILLLLSLLVTACATVIPLSASPTPLPTATSTVTVTVTLTVTPTVTETPSPTITPTPTRDYPPEGYGPSGFPSNVNPLTGLKVENPALLERRPIIVKVANLPRAYRPQWGLSLADHVYEYYIEEGTTRFAAVFLGQDAAMVGPIRSGRLFDHHLINMYRANFAFGSADARVRALLYNQSYANRLVIESACPPMCRYEPNGVNYLMTNTADLTTYINNRRLREGNGRQNLDGLAFDYDVPAGGQAARVVFVRYSAAIYNRWDYDPQTGKYARFSDTQNDLRQGLDEFYAPLTDRLTGTPITADNVVVLFVSHRYFSRQPEIIDIVFSGPDKAYLLRDGQMFALQWYRNALDQLFILVGPDGKPFPLKPGNTWFEIVGTSTQLTGGEGGSWRFTFQIP